MALTKKEMFQKAIELATTNNDTELCEFFNKEIARIEARNSKASLVAIKRRNENEERAKEVYSILDIAENPMRASDLAFTLNMSCQKVSSLLSMLVKEGKVVRTKEKGNSFYSVA